MSRQSQAVRLVLVVALQAVLWATSPYASADWLAPRRDQSRNPYVSETLRPPLALKWHARLSGGPEGASLREVWVVEGGGVVCVRGDFATGGGPYNTVRKEHIWGLDSATGELLWSTAAGVGTAGDVLSLMLRDGRLFLATEAGAAALDPKSGRWLWRRTDKETAPGVAWAHGTLLCGRRRLDPETGEVLGTIDRFGSILYRDRYLLGCSWGNKRMDNGYEVMDAMTGERVGAVIFDYPSGLALVPSLVYGDLLFGDVGLYHQGDRTGFIESPKTFERNRGLCGFRVNGQFPHFPLQAFGYERGYERVWYRRNWWGGQVICVDPRAVYGRLYRWPGGWAPGESAIYALDPRDASTLWRSRTLGDCGVGSYADTDYGSMFVLAGDVLWGWSPEAGLVSVDARSGALLDRDRAVRATKSVELVVSGGRLFIEMDGGLACFEHDPEGRLPQGVTGAWWRPSVLPDPQDSQPKRESMTHGSVEVLIRDRTALSLRWAEEGALAEQNGMTAAEAEKLAPLVGPERSRRLAWTVADQLQDLLDEGAFDPKHLRLASEGSRVAVRHGDRAILDADPVQARLQQTTVRGLAEEWARGIQAAFQDG